MLNTSLHQLEYIEYVIHPIAFVFRLVRWNHKYSFLFFITWILWQSIYPYIMCILPALVFLLVQTKPNLTDSISEVEQTFSSAYHLFSHLNTSLLCAVLYIAWILLLHNFSKFVWWALLIVLCLESPWAQMIYSSLFVQKNTQQFYCFELYHHQRWRFAKGWCDSMLPQDPPTWSDLHLEPACSTDTFRLPPTTRKHNKYVSWTWVDPVWSRKEGWEYSNGGDWKTWQTTRRERWYRFAERKEYWAKSSDDMVSLEEPCLSLSSEKPFSKLKRNSI